MSNADYPPRGALAPELLREINAVCLKFEQSWQSGPPYPRPEDFLPSSEWPMRAALLRELLLLEVHYRQSSGEDVSLEAYRQRFPGQDFERVQRLLRITE